MTTRYIELKTGNFNFCLEKGDNIIVNRIFSFPSKDWSLFISQINECIYPKMGFLEGFFNNRIDVLKNLQEYERQPLGAQELKSLFNFKSTPEMQLFLAAMDFADRFLFEKCDKRYKSESFVLFGNIPSVFNFKGLYLLDDRWIEGNTEELSMTNRLGQIVFDKETTRYYIPYAVPYKPSLSKEATKIWNKIRDRM